MDEHLVRKLIGYGLHGIHIAKGCADNQVEAFACQAAKYLFGIRTFGDQLNERNMGVGDVLFHIQQTIIVGFAPATIIVRANQDHGDIELILFDGRDLKASHLFGFPSPTSTCR